MVENDYWPDRLKNKLLALQYQSELIVASVQLGIITLLYMIILTAPIGYSPDAPIHSALLGLSLFTILVLVRLWFAYTKQLTPLFLGFSVVAEMALLLFIIWTYFLQFEATPTINLKNSHINYVFVLIALRALRFEPIWVLLSGATAVLGWFLIVWHALHFSGMQVITWDYVTYASSRSIYLGAEFDKVLTIGLITLVIALVLKRAQNTLHEAVSQTFKAQDLSHFFDSAVVEKITLSESALKAGSGEMRNAVIMFIDLRGFSKLSEKLSSTDLLSLLGEYQSLLVPIIQQHQGSIDKFMGDGILASFGAVISSSTYAADSLYAVDSILSAVQQWQMERSNKGDVVLEVGMGLAIGEVLYGMIGHETRLEYTVIGEAVNVAAKLEKHNKAEKVKALATLAVLEMANQQGYKSITEKEIRYNRAVAGIDEMQNLVVLA